MHGRYFIPGIHKLWYYARELQNGVILLKVPREVFQSNAAKLTQCADTFYKSGYLWKTLFPKIQSEESAIVALIDEALHNVNVEESGKGIIIGYANTHHPFEAIKLRIQVTGKIINSAFPTWGQPMTGNNGKPYSHLDTIHFRLAESTFLFDEENSTILLDNSILPIPCDADEVVNVTPEWMLSRKKPNSNDHDKWTEDRGNELASVVEKITEPEIQELQSYLKDPVLFKQSVIFMSSAYNIDYGNISTDQRLQNALALYQNMRDGILVISEFDKLHGSDNIINLVEYYLQQKFIDTGGLDLWENIRLHRYISNIILEHPADKGIARYLDAIAFSPCRIGAYIDFNMNPYMGLDRSIIAAPECKIPVFERYFYDFVAQNLGENYIVTMTHNQRVEYGKSIAVRSGKFTRHMIRDCLKYSYGTDFDSAGWSLGALADKIIDKKLPAPNPVSLERIFMDFHRCKVVERTRTVLEHYEALKNEPDPYKEFGTKKYNEYIDAKHLVQFVKITYEMTSRSLAKLADYIGENELSLHINKNIECFHKELVPLPEEIPAYIKNWKHNDKVIRLANSGPVPAEYVLDLLGLTPDAESD